MPARFLRPVLFTFAWLAASVLLYGGLFGFHTLGSPELELQLHNTYIVLTPGHALGLLALLLSPAAGAFYLLLKPRPLPFAVWLTGLCALLLIYAAGTIVELLTLPCPVGLVSIYQPDTATLVPANSLVFRLQSVLRGLQVLMGVIALLAGHALGRRSQAMKTPGPHS